jgi:hypothetical protein
VHLKHGYCMLIHFIHGYCIYRTWQPLTNLYFLYCISLIYFSFTKIRMFLYARIYWLAEFGNVSCLTIWEWRLSLRHGILSLSLRPGKILSNDFKSETLFKSNETLCPTWEYDRWYTWRDLYIRIYYHIYAVNYMKEYWHTNVFQSSPLIMRSVIIKKKSVILNR